MVGWRLGSGQGNKRVFSFLSSSVISEARRQKRASPVAEREEKKTIADDDHEEEIAPARYSHVSAHGVSSRRVRRISTPETNLGRGRRRKCASGWRAEKGRCLKEKRKKFFLLLFELRVSKVCPAALAGTLFFPFTSTHFEGRRKKRCPQKQRIFFLFSFFTLFCALLSL